MMKDIVSIRTPVKGSGMSAGLSVAYSQNRNIACKLEYTGGELIGSKSFISHDTSLYIYSSENLPLGTQFLIDNKYTSFTKKTTVRLPMSYTVSYYVYSIDKKQ